MTIQGTQVPPRDPHLIGEGVAGAGRGLTNSLRKPHKQRAIGGIPVLEFGSGFCLFNFFSSSLASLVAQIVKSLPVIQETWV